MKIYLAVLAFVSLSGAACAKTTIDERGMADTPSADDSSADAASDGAAAVDAADVTAPKAPEEAPDPSYPIYRLVEERNLASPTTPPLGITYDGTGIWILSGIYDRRVRRLVRFDPDALTIDRDFTLPIGEEAVAQDGITWDGEAIWIVASTGAVDTLMALNPMNGQITRTISVPKSHGWFDLDHRGGRLWVSTGIRDVLTLNLSTGESALAFTFPWYVTSSISLAIRPNGEVWVSDSATYRMFVYDSNGIARGSALRADGTPLREAQRGPSVFIGSQLVVLSERGITYYSVTTF